ncbi:hypothetical protein E2562_003066 [Oryza meyeriana var. granulata]|uniref:Uncharacterized protein n=1 Tax=Oryza meyeriana var. granulata TaxID=110450 RepID=A0A6G1E827_9ORYZ|nr:hypothetical protein E2562_003066 [Oryza meyeriana var. granulata]
MQGCRVDGDLLREIARTVALLLPHTTHQGSVAPHTACVVGPPTPEAATPIGTTVKDPWRASRLVHHVHHSSACIPPACLYTRTVTLLVGSCMSPCHSQQRCRGPPGGFTC